MASFARKLNKKVKVVSSLNPYISQAMCIVSFPHDEQIRYQLREVESSFHSLNLAQAKSPNVADDMPSNLPRFILESGSKQLTVSQVNAQLTLNFEDETQLMADSFDIVEKNFKLFWGGVGKLKKVETLKNLGVVLTICCPVEKQQQDEIAKSIFAKFSKFPQLGEVASANMQFGFLDKGANLYRNISIGHYETRQGEVKPTGKKTSIDIESFEIKEVGVEIKMDVNTRPMTKSDSALTEKSGELVLNYLKNFALKDGREFTSW